MRHDSIGRLYFLLFLRSGYGNRASNGKCTSLFTYTGTAVYGSADAAKTDERGGLAGMIIGILSYVLCWIPVFDFILGLIGVILSDVGLSRKERYRLNGFAVAGLVLSIIGLVIGFIIMIVFFVALGQTV